jgi:hypothetical protein|tara:strand:- start:1027 stop:1302 length:276 start_codon:yes stop_codon:yes gene_type:complete
MDSAFSTIQPGLTMAELETMTPDTIELALAKLAPDALGLLEGVLRGTKRPNKAQLDAAWRVLDVARARQVVSLEAPEIEELRNVLQLVADS